MEIAIGNTRINCVTTDRMPVTRYDRLSSPSRTGSNACPAAANALGLLWSEDNKTQSFVDQHTEHVIVASRLGQPHRLGLTVKSITEISDTPMHLRGSIALVTERQDCMIVGLRYGIAMSTVPGGALNVGGKNAAVSLRVMLPQPGKQCRSKIKTDMRVVIDDLLCTVDNNPGRAIRPVTLGVNAFIPIMKRQRAWFWINNSGPGILAWRLIEVSVND